MFAVKTWDSVPPVTNYAILYDVWNVKTTTMCKGNSLVTWGMVVFSKTFSISCMLNRIILLCKQTIVQIRLILTHLAYRANGNKLWYIDKSVW